MKNFPAALPPLPAAAYPYGRADKEGRRRRARGKTFRQREEHAARALLAPAAKDKKIKAAGYATLKSVYSVSKDFDETFMNNPSPKSEDASRVIDRIKEKAKSPQEAREIAYQMRNKRDFPALRDAEHYLWACSEASESRWKAAQTMITTPMYSAAKLPGLRSIFFDENTSPPSASEIKWGWKGAKDCVK
jgi:hypothetical protein